MLKDSKKADNQKEPPFDLNAFFPDFEVGMLRENRSYYNYRKTFDPQKKSPVMQQRRAQFDLLRKKYDNAVKRIKEEAASDSTQEKIPRIIHQIWLGSPVRKSHQEWMRTWMGWYGWEYKLWTDAEVQELQLINQDAYDQANNYGEKADILRLEVLYMLGGLYADVDFKCVESDFFELLHRTTNFYICLEPLEHEFLRFGNSLIGSSPGHPLLANMIEQIKENSRKISLKNVLDRTGPRLISQVIYEYFNHQTDASEVNLFLPAVSFFPYSGHDFGKQHANTLPPLKGTAAIHYWTGSWAH